MSIGLCILWRIYRFIADHFKCLHPYLTSSAFMGGNAKGPLSSRTAVRGVFVVYLFVTSYHSIAQTGLELVVMSFLSLLNAGIRDISHHAWQFSMSCLYIPAFPSFVSPIFLITGNTRQEWTDVVTRREWADVVTSGRNEQMWSHQAGMSRRGHQAGISRCGHARQEWADVVWISMALSRQFRCFRWRWKGRLRAIWRALTIIPMLCFKRLAIRPTSILFTYNPEKPWCQGCQQQALFKCRMSLSYPPHKKE